MARFVRLVLFMLLAGLTAAVWAGESSAATAEEGSAIFQSQCASCHTIGGGDKVGPDLQGVGSRRDRAWLERFLRAPDQVIASGDPIATELVKKYGGVQMPNLGLTDDQVASLLAFLGVPSAGVSPPPATAPAQTTPAPEPAPAPAGRGDAAAGKNLFTGADRLENDGPPCMSCHAIAGIGALGGGALGPDLTGAYAKYGGDEGIASVLASLPFPTMQPIFSGAPLTAQEQADLGAFLAQASRSERPAGSVGKLIGLGFGGAALLSGLALLVWRRRLVAVRRPLVDRSRPRRK